MDFLSKFSVFRTGSVFFFLVFRINKYLSRHPMSLTYFLLLDVFFFRFFFLFVVHLFGIRVILVRVVVFRW